MKTAEVQCDCGKYFTGEGYDDFTAITKANRQRARCREADPDGHKKARQITTSYATHFVGETAQTH